MDSTGRLGKADSCRHSACDEKESSWDRIGRLARQIHSDTALRTRERVAGPLQAIYARLIHVDTAFTGDWWPGETFLSLR